MFNVLHLHGISQTATTVARTEMSLAWADVIHAAAASAAVRNLGRPRDPVRPGSLGT